MRAISIIKGCLLGAAIFTITGTAIGQELKKVSMSLAGQSMIAAVPRFAKELGLFEKRGLDVSFVTMDSANASATGLIAGSVQYAFSGPVELITAQARGRDVVTIANTYGGLGGSLVLSKAAVEKMKVPANAPLNERLKALNGLTIATPSATSAYTVSFKGAAMSVGADVKFTYMAIASMPSALESGAIQGYVASAPFWVFPITSGKGVLWISGPKGELPAELRPRSNSVLLTMRDTAKANPDLTKSVAGVFTDFAEAIDKRPADVKAAVMKVFPNVDSRTLEILFETEAMAWKAKPLTAADIVHEIAYVKAGGVSLPAQLDKVPPAAMVWP